MIGPSKARLAVVVAAWALLGALAAPARAESLHVLFPQTAEVTVVQGSSADFAIEVDAYGATSCSATTVPVVVDSVYMVDRDGGVASGDARPMPIETTEQRGSSDNCYIRTPVVVPLSATAAADTPPGDYTGVVRYGKRGGEDEADLDGPVLTVHVVEPEAEPQALPAHALTPPEIVVLGVREPAGPRYGKTQLLTRVRGTVRVRMPGKPAQVLGERLLVPNGTLVDAAGGVVAVTVERRPGGELESVDAWGGSFVTSQIRGLTTFRLAGRLTSARRAAAAVRATRSKRRLWVNGKGNFKTRGKRASAIVRGTYWLTEETKRATKVSVRSGLVAVRDFVRRRTILVSRGQSYSARERVTRIRRVPAFTGRARG